MQNLSQTEINEVSGGLMLFAPTILEASSAFGHLGRAFSFGYAIGTGINWYIRNVPKNFGAAARAGHE